MSERELPAVSPCCGRQGCRCRPSPAPSSWEDERPIGVVARTVIVAVFVVGMLLVMVLILATVPSIDGRAGFDGALLRSWVRWLPIGLVVGVPLALMLRLLARVPEAWPPIAVGITVGVIASRLN